MRINLDSKFFTDARFKLLVHELGEHRFQVLGRIVELWHYCYVHLTTLVDPKMIDAICERKGFAEGLIRCELGEPRDGKVHVRGVRKRIENYLKAIEDGKKSAAMRRQKYGTAQPDRWKSEGLPKVPSKVPGRSSEGSPEGLPNPHSHSHIQIPNTHTSTSSPEEMPITRIDEIWNTHCGSLGKVSKLTDKRRRFMKARLADNSDAEYWKAVICRIAGSSFCCGLVERTDGHPPWTADFDWLMKPDNHVKVMEGKYDDKKNPAQGGLKPDFQLSVVRSLKRVRD